MSSSAKITTPVAGTNNNHVPIYNGGTDTWDLANPVPDFYVSGQVLDSGLTGFNNNTIPTEGRLTIYPVRLGRRLSFDRLYSYITVAGSAGAVVRFVAYAHTNGAPGALLAEASGVVATGTGAIFGTVSFTAGPGVMWVGAAVQGAASTRPTMSTGSAIANLAGLCYPTTQINQFVNLGFYTDIAAGAAPGTWSATTVNGSDVPKVWARMV